jgi:hypothetical protein
MSLGHVLTLGFSTDLRAPFYGEDLGTGLAIEKGANYEYNWGWKMTEITRSSDEGGNSGMGGNAGRNMSRYRR